MLKTCFRACIVSKTILCPVRPLLLLFSAFSVRIRSVVNRSNRDTTVFYGLVFSAFSWPYLVKWHNSGIINTLSNNLKLEIESLAIFMHTFRVLGMNLSKFQHYLASSCDQQCMEVNISCFLSLQKSWQIILVHQPRHQQTPLKVSCFFF